MQSAVTNMAAADRKEIQEIARNEYLAVLFIKQVGEVRFGELKTTLANGHLNPTSAECGYPKTL